MRRSIATILALALLSTTVRAEDATPAAPPPPPPVQPPVAAPPAPPAPAKPGPPTAPAPAKPAPAPAPEQAADAVLAAVKAKDDAALKASAAKDDPDPWLVADELIRRGEHDAAEAFAKAAPRVDVERLPEYVSSRRAQPAEVAVREALAAVTAASQRGDYAGALARIDSAGALPATIVGVRMGCARGFAMRGVGRLRESADAYRAAAKVAGQLGWSRRAAWAMGREAASADAQSDHVRCLSAAEERLALERTRQDVRALAEALMAVGAGYLGVGQPGKAIEQLEQAQKVCERLENRAALLGGILANLGSAYLQLDEYATAAAHLERSLKEFEPDGNLSGAVTALSSLAGLNYRRGDLDKALDYAQRTVAGLRTLGSREHLAGALRNLGLVAVARNDHSGALGSFQEALKVAQEVGNRRGAAECLASIASTHRHLGEVTLALEEANRALAEQRALGDRMGCAGTLSTLGSIYEALGNHAQELQCYDRALRGFEELGARDGVARTLVGQGRVHLFMGTFAQASDCLERALAVCRALGDRLGTAGALLTLGNVKARLGDHAESTRLFREAYDLYEAAGAPGDASAALVALAEERAQRGDELEDVVEVCKKAVGVFEAEGYRRGVAGALCALGLAYRKMGDRPRARDARERALAVSESAGDLMGSARVRIGLGALYEELGDRSKATAAFERAEREAERVRANELHVWALVGLARLHLASGDASRAHLDARRAASLLETVLSGLGEEASVQAREEFSETFRLGSQAASRDGDSAGATYFLEGGRAGTLMEALGGRQAMRWAELPDDLRVAKAEAQAKEALAVREYQKVLDSADLAAVRERSKAVDEAQNRVREVVERIQREAKKQAAVWYPRAATMEEIQGWLAEGDVLVLYGVGGEDALALVLTRTDARIVPLGKSAVVAEACEALQADDPGADPAPALARLRRLVVEPLGIEKAKRVLVSPEGALSYVPFAALLPDVAVAIVPSGTTYGLLLEDAAKRGEQVLAAGDPDYGVTRNATAAGVYERGGRLLPLPGTRGEAKAVGDVLLLGADASEVGLRDALAKRPRWRSVHLACHGLVDVERPTLCSLALTPDPANDGYLTALEVLDLEVPADLAVLSACETGKGKIVNGEGIVGLTRAFMYAGAPRVICSLWKVDDEATRALMTEFYRLWNPKDGTPGLPTAEALRKAQAFVRDDPKHPAWKHPYYWAAWVLWGLPQ